MPNADGCLKKPDILPGSKISSIKLSAKKTGVPPPPQHPNHRTFTPMQSLPQLLNLLQGYSEKNPFPESPAELYDPCAYILTLGGKRIRPALLLVTNHQKCTTKFPFGGNPIFPYLTGVQIVGWKALYQTGIKNIFPGYQSVLFSIIVRLEKLIKALGLNQTSFAKSLGMTQPNINRMVSGNSSISVVILNRIAKKIEQVNLHGLLTGVGEMLLDDMQTKRPQVHEEPVKWKERLEQMEARLEELNGLIRQFFKALEK